MQPADFQFIQEAVHRLTAIKIDAEKLPIVRARLAQLVQAKNYKSIHNLIDILRTGDQTLLWQVIDHITNHETSFFRDIHPFHTLRQHIIPHLIQAQRHSQSLHIWCAACSTGQEPYSVLMLLREHFPDIQHWNIHLFASDISNSVLERAKCGEYNQFEVSRGLPTPLLLKYFHQNGSIWKINDSLIHSVEFFQHSLQAPWPFTHRVDLILLRNALIYFEPETRIAIFNKFYDGLHPHGALMLGCAETTLHYTQKFEAVIIDRTAFYKPLP